MSCPFEIKPGDRHCEYTVFGCEDRDKTAAGTMVIPHSSDKWGYQPSEIPREMLCRWYCAGNCEKGLPGTKCELKGCVAWEENKVSVYDFGVGGIGIIETQYKELAETTKDFIETVERYVTPTKGQFCHRSELLRKLNQLKSILNGKEVHD